MGNNVYLIYGEDTYRSRQKLEAIKQRYRAKFADLEIIQLAGDVSLQELEGKLFAPAMFVARKLVIVKNLLGTAPRKLQERLLTRINQVPATTVIVFYEEGQVDRRLALFRALNRPGYADQYKLLTQIELKQWIERTAATRGATITPGAADELSLWFGPDTWRISHELDKLTTVTLTIDTPLLKQLVAPEPHGNIFDLLDALFSSNRFNVVNELQRLVTSGQPLLQIVATIASSLRNLILIKETVTAEPSISSFQIARKLALHPYVVAKALQAAKRADQSELTRKLDVLQRIDRKIKTGTMEAGVALEILVAELLGGQEG